MTRFVLYRSAASIAAIALCAGIGSANAVTNYRLTNPQDWANAQSNERPTMGDATTGTVNGDSWVSNPAVTQGGNQHFLFFQGGNDSQDPATADPENGSNPQLLFDASDAQDSAETQVTMSDITRIAWDTKKSSASSSSGGHWFFNVFTRPDEDDDQFFGHNLNFALTDNTGYTPDQFNTLESNKDGNTSSGGLEVQLYDHQRLTPNNDGTDEDDRDEFESQTLSEWTADANKGNAPDWWDEQIRFAGMATATNYNNGDSTFISNLDNFQFNSSQSDAVNIDLGVPGGGTGGGGTDVPEPGNILLLGLGLVMTMLLGRRRKQLS